MKTKPNRFLLSSIAAVVAMAAHANADTFTYTGNQITMNQGQAPVADYDTVEWDITGGYFGTSGDRSQTYSNPNLIFTNVVQNNGWGNAVTRFSSATTVTGAGTFSLTTAGLGQDYVFAGNMQGYSGNVSIAAFGNTSLTLEDPASSVVQYGGESAGGNTALGSITSDSSGNWINNVAGTGSLTVNNLVFNYGTDASYDYVRVSNTIEQRQSINFTGNANVLASGVISGAGALNTSGTGTLTLTANNTYAGTTTISGGTLQIGDGGTTGTLGSGSVSIASGAELILNRSNTRDIANAFSGDGTIVLRGGTGSANSFSGNWVNFTNATDSFSSPTLHLDTGASLTDRGEIVFGSQWGDGSSNPKFQLASLSGWGDFRSDTGSTGNRTISVNSTGTHEYQGRIVQNNNTLRSIHFEKLGSGIQIFSGENAYQNTIVGGGTLQIGNGGTTGNIGLGTVSVASGATLEFNRSNLIDYKASVRMRNVSGAGDIVIDGGAKFFNYTGGASGFNEANSWNNFSGNLIIKGGSEFQTIRNGATAMGTSQIVLGDATTSGKLSQIEGNWTWTNNISLVGSANEILNNSTGGDRWNKIQGVISGDGNVTFANPGGGMNNGNFGFILTGTNTMSGTVTVDTFVRVGGVTGESISQAAGTGGTLGTANVVINSDRRLTFSRSNAHTVANEISGAGRVHIGSTGITGTNTQDITLSGNNTYSGGTELLQGTLRVNALSGIGTGYLAVKNGSTFRYTGTGSESTTRTLWMDDGAATIHVEDASAQLTWNPGGGTRNQAFTKDGAGELVLGGAISGASGSVTVAGGTLTLTDTSSYVGDTTVSAGTLIVNGNISTSTLTTVESGATIGGSGTVGALTVLAGGILAPGTSPGTLNTGTLSLADTSTLNFELNPGDNTVGLNINDLVNVTGGLTLDGILNVTATSGDFLAVTQGTMWRLFDYSGALTDNTLSFGTMPSLDSGLTWSIDTATSGEVNLVVIPEPAAALLGGIGLILLLRRRRPQPVPLAAVSRSPVSRVVS